MFIAAQNGHPHAGEIALRRFERQG